MQAIEALAHELRGRGLKYIFGIPGKESLRLGVAVERLGARFVAARHETQAVMMADGYWRAKGELGVALVAQGAGLANAIGGMACAARAKSGVVVISGDLLKASGADAAKAKALQRLKGVDPRTLCEGVDVTYIRPETPEAVLAEARDALDLAASGHTVALNIPSDLFAAEVSWSDGPRTRPAMSTTPPPQTSDVETVVEVLTSFAASRPAIVAGRGAIRAGALPALRALASRIGAVVGTTLPARSAFRGDPYDLGVCGTFATPAATDLLQQADTIVVFGASLNPFTTYGATLFGKKTRVIQIDVDANAFGKYFDPELGIPADARLFAEALVTELDRRGHKAEGLRTPEVATRLAQHDERRVFTDGSENGYIDPRTLMVELDGTLPRDRIVVVDAGLHLHYACTFLQVERPEDFIFPIDSLAIGLGMGAAVGAALAFPERTTLLEVGDAGLMMALGDLETAVRLELPMVVVISNDQAWGAEAQHLRMLQEPETFVRITTPSLADVANAMGAEGHLITSPAELRALSPRLRERPRRPLVLDCRVHPAIQPPSFNFDYAGVFAK